MKIKGLTKEQAKKNQLRYGFNELLKTKKNSPLKIFFSQFSDFLTITLICAMLLSAFMGEYSDAVTVLIIIATNGALGFVQEYKTEKSLEALSKLSAPTSVVVRDGEEIKIPSREVTVGDVVVLEAGDRICADCTVLESMGLCVDESMLTGESVAIEKDAFKNTAIYMGTTVISGRCRARAEAIGMSTKMGSIAHMLENTVSGETPLKKHLNKIGRELVLICLGVCALIFVAGLFHGESVYNMFLSSISLAVAAIPEGLPAVVTVSLSIGVARMLKRNALIRKLPAVETLGCTNVICSDKTGTLTQNKMTVKKIWCDGKEVDVQDDGTLTYLGKNVDLSTSAFSLLLTCAFACNNAVYRENELSGDPTEVAIYSLSEKSGAVKKYGQMYERISETPFDSNRKCMSVICKDKNGNKISFVKGAADKIIDRCIKKQTSTGVRSFDNKYAVKKVVDKMSDNALRVLAFAYKVMDGKGDDAENDLVFIGLEGMIDPPRKEAYDAIKTCYQAQIKPVMITGDHKNTARAIADELGFVGDNEPVTGEELEKMSDDELLGVVKSKNIFARVSPGDKLRIVKAFKRQRNIVAMTGDGVNDAPSLKEADIGISMGRCGTDVAKQASDMILLDDNFSTIISAVEEGRMIYANIRKFIRYLLSCNLGEIILMGASAFCGLPMPLVPIQILWMNLVTDGLPALALGVDNPQSNLMKSPPRKEDESIFSKGLGGRVVLSGVLIGGEALMAFSAARFVFKDLQIAQTVAFSTLIFSELVYAFECKSEKGSVLNVNVLDNLYLLGAVVLSFALTLAVIYIPPLASIFKTVPLTFVQWILVVAFGLIEAVLNIIFVKKNIE